jgi:hypothetical protein
MAADGGITIGDLGYFGKEFQDLPAARGSFQEIRSEIGSVKDD